MTDRLSRPDSWRAEFIAQQRFRCHYCNRRGGTEIGPDDRAWHLDHKNPLSRGGEDIDENLVLACKRCNLTKGAKPYREFKEFAELAFWVPDDWRLSEGDLDSLMRLYTLAVDKSDADTTWHINATTNSIDVYNADSQPGPILRGEGDYFGAVGNQRFILDLVFQMHDALPALIAEVRMHREAERLAAEPPV